MMKETLQAFARCELKVEQAEWSGGNGEMDKILTFIVNEYNEILLLKGSENDPQFKESFWYVVTGGCEKYDLNREETVKREVKEETNLLTNNNIYLNWILEYESLGVQCKEYVYISFVNKDNIILNEESIDYKWCKFDEFMEKINWFGNKQILEKVVSLAIKKELFFKSEKIDKF